MKHLLATLAFIMLLTISSPGISYVGGPGSVAEINLGNRFNTTLTLDWSFIGTSEYLVIYVSVPNVPGERIFARVGSWKTSCVVKGLPPGVYDFRIQAANGGHFITMRVTVVPGSH